DAERAAERRDHAGARPPCQPRRQRVQHAGAGRHDDDERGQEKLDSHMPPSLRARKRPRTRVTAGGSPATSSPVLPVYVRNVLTAYSPIDHGSLEHPGFLADDIIAIRTEFERLPHKLRCRRCPTKCAKGCRPDNYVFVWTNTPVFDIAA